MRCVMRYGTSPPHQVGVMLDSCKSFICLHSYALLCQELFFDVQQQLRQWCSVTRRVCFRDHALAAAVYLRFADFVKGICGNCRGDDSRWNCSSCKPRHRRLEDENELNFRSE